MLFLLIIDFVDALTLFDCLLLNFTILLIAILGIIVNRRNLIILFLCLEVILLIISLNFFYVSFFFNNPLGYIYGFIVITLAASESVIGITLLVLLFRLSGRLSFDTLITLRG